MRNLKHRAFSGRIPAAAARPAVARTSRACIIVYILYFRIRGYSPAADCAHRMQQPSEVRMTAAHRSDLIAAFRSPAPSLGPTDRRPSFAALPLTPFSTRRRAFSRAVATHTGPLSGVTTPHAEPCTAGTLPKDSGVDGRRGGTYLLPSRGGDTPRGREATRCGATDTMRCGGTACGRGGTMTLGSPHGTWHGG